MARNEPKEIPNLLRSVRNRLPAANEALLDAIVKQAGLRGTPIYLVGGFIRDLLLKRPNLDLDLVLEGNAIQLARALTKRYGGRLVAHKTFGTAVWWLPEGQTHLLRTLRVPKKKNARLPKFFDLITARRETYKHPAALPSVQFASIHEDQYRRDFTINTLAVRLDGADAGRLLDPWGGLRDLHDGLLRTLHPASFSDDPTRILRILRLAGRLGFKIEKSTRAQLNNYLAILKRVSGERIRTELELVLLEKERVSILRSMHKLGVLQTIHPKLRLSNASAHALESQERSIPSFWNLGDVSRADLGFVLLLMNLSPVHIVEIATRLSFRSELRAAVLGAAKLKKLETKMSKLTISKTVELIEGVPDLAIYAVYLAGRNSNAAERLKLYSSKWRNIQPRTDGNRLRKLGLKPGPIYKLILSKLRAAWLDGKIRTAKQEQALVDNLLIEHR